MSNSELVQRVIEADAELGRLVRIGFECGMRRIEIKNIKCSSMPARFQYGVDIDFHHFGSYAPFLTAVEGVKTLLIRASEQYEALRKALGES